VRLEAHDVTARHFGSVIVSKEFGKRLEMRFPLRPRLRIIDPFFSRPFLDELGEGGLAGSGAGFVTATSGGLKGGRG
jgi:hypothetical protein